MALKSRDARYISQRAANAIISEVGPYRISTDALQSINTFLDEFLLQLVNTALSLDLSRIKTSVNQLLPSNLGKNAIVEAELEVKTFTESGERVDYSVYERMRRLGTGQDAFPADRVLPQFREKCMFYCTLADKEAPGVNRQVPEDQDRDVIISPIVAIYVTAVVEHIAEYLLTLIAKAAEHEDTEFVRVKEVFTALIDDSQVGKVFYRMELKEKLEKRLFAYGYNTRPMTPTHDPIRNIASPPPTKREPSRLNNEQGASRDYHFDVDFDEVDNDARAGATSPPPQSSNGGVHRTNTVSSNSSGKGNKDRSSMRLASAQTYRPTSVLSTNTGSSGTLVSPSGSPNGKGGKGSSFKIFGGGNKKKSGYEYGLESPTGNGGIDYDNDGYVEDDMDKSLDFEKLIQSGQTMKVTLTPNRLRTIEVKDQPGGKRTTPASSSWSQRAPPIPTKSTSSSSLPPPLPEKRVNFATSSRDEEDDDDDDDLDDEFPMGGRRKGGKEESLFDFLRSTGPEDYGSKPSVGRTTSPTRNGSGPTTPRHVPIVIPQSNINDTNSKLNKLGMGSPTRGTSANMNSVDRPLPPPSSPRSPRSPSQQSPQGEYPPSYLRPAIKRNGSNTNESTNSTNSNSSGRSDSPLRPRPPASAPARGEDEDDDDNDDLDDLLTDGTGGQRRNKRVSYMSETSTLIDFLSSTTPSSPAPAARTPSAATNSPPFNTRPRADSVNGGKKFVKIEIPKVESIEKMLKGQDSPKLPTEYKLPPGYQPVPGSGITGMKVPDEQVETVEKEVAQKEEMVPEIKIEEPEVKQPQPRSKSPIGAPRSGSLAERKVKFEQEAIAGEIDGVKSLRRKMPPTPSHDEKQQSTEPERPSARTRFDPTVNGTVSATNTAVVTAAVVTAEPESLPESEPNPEPLPSETKRERPPSMVAKRASLFNTLATQENITISAKEIHSLRKQLTSANSVEMSVRVWDDFLHKNGGAVMHRRTTLRRANLTESEDEREQQLLQDIAANDAGANSDDGSASGSGRDSAGSERSNTRDSVVMTRARRFENPEEQQNSFEKAERTRAAEAIAAAREKREARRSLIMLANQRPPRPVMVEIAIQTDVVEPEPPEPVVVTAAKVETVSSTEASADSPVTAVAEEKPKSQNPMLVLSAENEDGSVVEQEVELSDVETEEEEKGVVIGDEEWFLDADEEWEDNEADEALVAEWLLGEAVLAF